MKRIALGLIRLYQSTLSQIMPPSCKFTPTCSQYTFDAVRKYGTFKGCWLGMKRILRCNPFNSGGFDPVP